MKKFYVSNQRFTRMVRWLTGICLVLVLSACATGSRQPVHTFQFDARFDDWATQADLLEFSYGDKERMTHKVVQPGQERIGYQWLVNGAMPIGEYLYVKWRITQTGEVIEDKVDLRPLLPWNLGGHTLTFVIDGRQLYVYLVTPQFKPYKSPPVLKTYLSDSRVTYEIYPRNTRPQ